MTLKQLKECVSRIPEEFDDTEVTIEQKCENCIGRYVHSLAMLSYGEYDGNEKFIALKVRSATYTSKDI